ncbi:MAG TPA: hypothetical protein VGP93_11470 [Polyangiaceae bacterium]|nr:hypothetical protein [Polyangiaceae bacterium]
MKQTVMVGAITASTIVAVLVVTVLVHGPPHILLPGIALVLILVWGTRSAIRRYGPRRE